MFAINRFSRPILSSARTFSAGAAAAVKAPFVPKTFYQVSVAEVGAYPVYVVIVGSVVFVACAGLYLGMKTPDARVSKSSRKNIFRGGVADEVAAQAH